MDTSTHNQNTPNDQKLKSPTDPTAAKPPFVKPKLDREDSLQQGTGFTIPTPVS